MRRAALAAVVSLLAFSVLAPTPAVGSTGEEGELLALVNGLRSSRGLRPVAVDPELRALAEDWAQRMAAATNIFHSPLDTRVGADWVHLGENVAVDVSVVAAEQTLEASPEHLANLLLPSYDYIGIGVAHGTDGGVYVVQDFMQLAGPPSKAIVGAEPPAGGSGEAGRGARPSLGRARGGLAPASIPRVLSGSSPTLSAPTQPRQPSVRLTIVFDQLRGLDADVTPPRRGYGLVRRNW